MVIMKMKLVPAATLMIFATVLLLLLGSKASVSASSTTTNHQRIPFIRGKVKTTTNRRTPRGWSSTHLLALSEDKTYTQQLDVLLHWQQQQRKRKQERQHQRSLALRQILRRHPASGNNCDAANEIRV
mmetsp:Transcript_39402/g.45041  ORF Transcript_39402/g.45041 Transcript_39402/m.45041 type:complete len:128 (-) Transcript_39402:229-612(-)